MNKLLGPFQLTQQEVDNYVMGSVPGNFALGYVKDHEFHAQYVGRADECINYRLKEWIGKYTHYKFGYTLSLREAFDRQCRFYHELNANGELMNETHPQPPAGTDYKCPYC